MFTFQKKSPYLEDVNKLIGLASQMGLVHGIFSKYVTNATKCSTWEDIKASHRASDHTVVVELGNIYGMLSLLAIGLTMAMSTFFAEAFLCTFAQK